MVRLIWPWWQRLLHWAMAATVLTALVTHEGGRLHERTGWAALACAAVRIVLGLAGPPVARFAAFVRSPAVAWAYLRQGLGGCAPRYLNHNPAGSWMVVALLAFAAGAAVSGALYVTDRFWGEAWLAVLHAVLAWPLAALVPLHLAGVLHASRAHHENLAAAMVHGRKELRPGDR